MDEEFEQSQPMPEPAPKPEPGANVNEALLQDTLERLNSRSDTTRRFACMSLPAPIFTELCRRLLDRTQTIKATSEWLTLECQDRDIDAPHRISVERFSEVLGQEYRAAMVNNRRQRAEQYVAVNSTGNPDTDAMALNTRVNELLTDAFLQIDDLHQVPPKVLLPLLMGARQVAQTAFDKQKMDARIKALEKLNQQREKSIEVLQQRLDAIPQRVDAIEKKLKGLQQSVKVGQEILPEIYDAIFAELTAIKQSGAAAAEVAHG